MIQPAFNILSRPKRAISFIFGALSLFSVAHSSGSERGQDTLFLVQNSSSRTEVQWPPSASYGPIHCFDVKSDRSISGTPRGGGSALAMKSLSGDMYQREVQLFWVTSCRNPQFMFSNMVTFEKALKEIVQPSDGAQISRAYLLLKNGAREIPAENFGPAQYARVMIEQGISFSTMTSRDLAYRFGVKFAQDVYLAWLDQRFDLLKVEDTYKAQMRMIRNSSYKTQFSTDAQKKPVLFVVNGQAGQETDLMVQLAKSGIEKIIPSLVEYRYALRKPVGEFRANVDAIKNQYLEVLKSGRDIYLFQISRGAQESLRAVAEITRDYSLQKGEQDFPQGWGKFRSSLNVVPLFSGSFLADYGQSQSWISWCITQIESTFSRIENRVSQSIGDAVNYIISGAKLTSREIQESQSQLADFYPQDLPQIVVTFFPQNGVYQNADRFHPSMIAQWIYRKLGIVKTGHDNLIEVGGTQFPYAKNKQKYVALDGTHMMNDVHLDLDGTNCQIKDSTNGPLIVEGLLSMMIENRN